MRVVPAEITATMLWEQGEQGIELTIATEVRYASRPAAAATSINRRQLSGLSYARGRTDSRRGGKQSASSGVEEQKVLYAATTFIACKNLRIRVHWIINPD